MSGCFLNLPVGTEVKLEGLSNAAYNGKRGRITVTAPDLMARDRVAVIVDGNTLSFKRANVARDGSALRGRQGQHDPRGPAADRSRAGVSGRHDITTDRLAIVRMNPDF